jgi:hypothetical protein
MGYNQDDVKAVGKFQGREGEGRRKTPGIRGIFD